MKAGVVYPQVELGGDTGAVKAFAQAAEDLGYDHIVIYDHVLGAVHAEREPKLTGPYKETDPFHEPLITFAYLAGITKKLEMATGVIILPQRQTVLFAKQAADVDLFSNGRLRLGVGVGWNSTVSKCPDIFAAAAGDRSCKSRCSANCGNSP
jgi:alkanesulfonate monooxygenase SsuD/methylene tetrahydromethanopterin reductase-like flavin-dependent oxidoreductase (luciferase family)